MRRLPLAPWLAAAARRSALPTVAAGRGAAYVIRATRAMTAHCSPSATARIMASACTVAASAIQVSACVQEACALARVLHVALLPCVHGRCHETRTRTRPPPPALTSHAYFLIPPSATHHIDHAPDALAQASTAPLARSPPAAPTIVPSTDLASMGGAPVLLATRGPTAQIS